MRRLVSVAAGVAVMMVACGAVAQEGEEQPRFFEFTERMIEWPPENVRIDDFGYGGYDRRGLCCNSFIPKIHESVGEL